MCESSIYLLDDGGETLLMNDVSWLEVDGDTILIRDIMGREKTLHARLSHADFVSHHVVLAPLSPQTDDNAGEG